MMNNQILKSKLMYKSADIAASDWSYITIIHDLGHNPVFVLATPISNTIGRFTWKINHDEYGITIAIYNMENSIMNIGFYIFAC